MDSILDGIGKGRPNLDNHVSCEPPWGHSIIPVLHYRRGHPVYRSRYQTSATNYDALGAPRPKLARAYIAILTWWTFGGDLDCLKRELRNHADLAETVYRRLGPPTGLKVLYVGKVRAAIGWQAFPGWRYSEHAEDLIKVYDAAIRQELGDKEDVIGRMIGTQDLCHHAFFRHIDHQLANIGAGKIILLPGAGEERKRIHGAVTNYVHVLGSWLVRRTVEEAVEIWPSCADIAPRVYDVLGEATPCKRWLVACLWKNLQDTDAHLGRGALDEDPERFAIPFEALKV